MKIVDNLDKNKYSDIRYFYSDNIKIIILPYNHNKPTNFISIDNGPFYAMIDNGGSKSSNNCMIKFNDDSVFYYNKTSAFYKKNSAEFYFLKQKDTMFLEDVIESEYVPYTNPIIIECAYTDSIQNIKLVITRPELDWTYDDFHLTVIKDNSIIEQLMVARVERYRDGGTTYYYTTLGTLFSPVKYSGQGPTWESNTIESFDVERLEDPYNFFGKNMCEKIGVDVSCFKSNK